MNLLRLSSLTDDQKRVFSHLRGVATQRLGPDEELSAYYQGAQRLEQLGIAVPPDLRHFETIVNWPATVVDEIERRLDVKGFVTPGENEADKALLEGWDINNLESESPLHHRETMILGRGFVSVGSNEDDPQHPLIRVEPPSEVVCAIDARRRSMLGALRSYKNWNGEKCQALMLPDVTIWARNTSSGWVIEDRDDHRLGRVPLVLFLNRRRAGEWLGTSEMAATIPLTNAAARALTDLQLAVETHAVPAKYVFGVDPKKMVDPDTGEPVTQWEAYYTNFMAHADKDVKAGQFEAADLKNFTGVINHYGVLVSSVTGLPLSYFTNSTVNPPAEGAVYAYSERVVKNVERKQVEWGDGWSWVAALYERFRTGVWPDGNRIRTEWHNAATPTIAQREDALQKRYAAGVISREGYWDELGWSEARKAQERTRLASEAQDPLLDKIAAGMNDDGQAA